MEDQNAFMLKELIEAYNGFDIITAGNGDEAIRIFGENVPDLVLLDLRIPGKNGFLVLEAMKKMDNRVPVIITTAYGDAKTRAKCQELGAEAFFTKPYNVRHLYGVMRDLASRHDLPLRTQDHYREVIKNLCRRLNVLEERKALLGLEAPPSLLIEIDDLRTQIEEAQAKLAPS